MSRLPQPSSSRPGAKSPFKSTTSSPAPRAPITPLAKPRAKTPVAAPTPTLRTQPSLKSLKQKAPSTPTKSPAKKSQPLPPDDDVPPLPKPQLSIREQIALRRAEAKKNMTKASTSPIQAEFAGLEDASPHTYNQPPENDVDLGRWSIKETIERGRSSGAINLSSRSLPCIPSALFEIHLGITPEPLKSVPVEPPITTSSSADPSTARRKGNAPSWYEAQDLEILKAWSNEIVEIQPELSMFGSLKTVDLRNNKLTGLPDTFADLTALTNVDLSHNRLTSVPVNFWALPHLTTLNLSHNALTTLPFGAQFRKGSSPLGRTQDSRGDWFSQSITRATEPLPRLTSLDVSHNPLSASSIDHSLDGPGLPAQLFKLDLSETPLGKSDSLFRALGRLRRLGELRLLRADIGDDSFPVSVFTSLSGPLFPQLKILDLEETYVTRPVIEAVFTPNVITQSIQFDVTTQEPPEGVLRIIVGKRVIREAWEIEADRRMNIRRQAALAESTNSPFARLDRRADEVRTSQEVEAEPTVLSEGAKRRARAMAAATPQSSAALTPVSPSPASTKPAPSTPQKPTVVEKEAWEIEAELGLLSAGARRRARAAAIAAAAASANPEPAQPAASRTPTPPSHTPATVGTALASPQYYDKVSLKLTLPTSAPPSKANHARSFSLASPAWSKGSTATFSERALVIPTPTLPLAVIAAQPLAQTLKVLVLANRRADPSFSIPAIPGASLPHLEELSLENCNLGDNVPVSLAGEGSESFALQRASEPLLPLLARLFPSVRTLDLSYNALTSAALTRGALSSLLFADLPPPGEGEGEEPGAPAVVRKGLRQLLLRGNRLNDLDGFQEVAERFKGNRNAPEWKLEELDLRDNEIGKLPAELGLLPLDVFLVDGNVFRVPPRRVWEREGTKGLLNWLRGRIE